MFTLKDLKGGKLLFRNLMPNILRRLSRSLSGERKRKNSCAPNQEELQNGTNPDQNTTHLKMQNGQVARSSRSNKKSKGRREDEENSKSRERDKRKFWARSSSGQKRVPLRETGTQNKDLQPNGGPNLQTTPSETKGYKWFMTPVFQSDAAENDCSSSRQPSTPREEKLFPADETREPSVEKNPVTCGICGEACNGETLRRRENDVWMHESCFVCGLCQTKLDPRSYYEHRNQLLCPLHYELVQSKLNALPRTCDSQIETHEVTPQKISVPEKLTSSKVFSNPERDASTAFNSKQTVDINKPCMPVAPGIAMNVCHICEQPVYRNTGSKGSLGSGALLVAGRLLHAECHICCRCGKVPKVGQEVQIQSRKVVCCNSVQRIKTCQGCLKEIMAGEATLSVSEGKKTWHRLCFRCCKCNQVISEEFFFKDHAQHCLRCYKKYCDVTCLSCNQLIVGEGVTTISGGNKSKRYHAQCAFCSVCGGPFKTGEQMLTEGDEIWHSKCSKLRISIRQMENFITGVPKCRTQQSSPSNLPSLGNIKQTPTYAPQPLISSPRHQAEIETPDIGVSVDQDSTSTRDTTEEHSVGGLNGHRHEHAEKCCIQVSYLSTEPNRHQITSPVHVSTSLQMLNPAKNPTLRPPNQTSGGNHSLHPDARFNTPVNFVSRLNQSKPEQQGFRGRPIRPMYSSRRKISGSRHVALEPTIEESEFEHETSNVEDEVAQDNRLEAGKVTEQRSGDDAKSLSSVGSTVSSNGFGSNEDKTSKCATNSATSGTGTARYFPYAQLRTKNGQKLPPGVDRKKLEAYLTDDEFLAVFRCRKREFYSLPKWRRDALKKERQLF